MAQDDEQQGETPPVDPVLVREVLSQTQTVNLNLSAILGQTESVVRRQNWLTTLFILSLAINGVQLALGFSMQQLQQSAKEQLQAVDTGRAELLEAVHEAKGQVATIREEVRSVAAATPTVTADKQGRISLEVPLDPAAQKTVSEQPQVSGDTRVPDKLVIPIRPAQSRLAN